MALIVVLVLLACLRFQSFTWVIGVLALAIALVGTWEVLKMGRHKGVHSSAVLGLVASSAFVLVGFAPPGAYVMGTVAIIMGLTLLAFVAQMLAHGVEDSFRAIPLGVFAPLYVGMPLAVGLQILRADRILFLYVLLLVWTLDTAAYYVGKRYGRHKLAPVLSPGKTREGAIGGLAGCVVVALALKALVPSSAFVLTWGEVIVTSLLIGVVGQIGDLAESALKRDAGVKDSGVAFTGHGGILDRVDSLLFVFPLFFLYLIFAGHISLFEVAVLALQ